MRNATYRDKEGKRHAAVVVGHTPAGVHLAIKEGDQVLIRGPVRHEQDVSEDDEAWSCAEHDYVDGDWSLGGQVKRTLVAV
jgi:hypothetical protein